MWFVCLINLLLWLVTFGFIGLAVYLHYFANTGKDVSGLLAGAAVSGWLAMLMTIAIAEEIAKRRR